jgi:gluconate 2-dehydrogenase gamma chain
LSPGRRPAASKTGGLDAGQLELLDAIVARLVPSDEHGPGAREAGVTGYIAAALDGEYRADRRAYADGLAAVAEHAAREYGGSFAGLTADQQDDVLRELEGGVVARAAAGSGGFFELLHGHVLEGMFGDPAWGGNAGGVGWDLLGYAGPRLEWTEEEQRLGAV